MGMLTSRDFWKEFGKGAEQPFRLPSSLSYAFEFYSDFYSEDCQTEKIKNFNKYSGYTIGGITAIAMTFGLFYFLDQETSKYVGRIFLATNAADLIDFTYKKFKGMK